MFSHVQLCTLCLRDLGFHAKPVFICNILKDDLYIASQYLGEGPLLQMSLSVGKGYEVGELVYPRGK